MKNMIQNNLPNPVIPAKRLAGIAYLLALTILSGCGGGADSQSKPTPANEDEQPVYTGSLQSDDIKAFKKELWEKISPSSVCGRCHRLDADPASRQAPYFADWQDVNFAYGEVVKDKLVNLVNPASSVLVQRVADGHQCWLGSTSLCETAMIEYITAWANGSKKGTTLEEFQIVPPSRIEPPGASLFFPVDAPASYTAFHNLVTNANAPPDQANCIGCHSSTAPASSAVTPFFADPDIATSYNAVKTVMNINAPDESRIYERLGAEVSLVGHNCWTDCITDSGTMLGLIDAIRAEILLEDGETTFNPDDAISMALQMQEGNVAASHNRYESDQIALYEFKSGSINPNSDTIYDTSGVEPALNLTLLDTKHRWLSNWGIEFSNGSRGAIASVDDSRKLYNLIRLTGEYSVEAWLIPANVNQENASIVAYSGGNDTRNFSLAQTMYNYDFFQRSSTLGADGEPKLMTNDDDEDLQATLQHVVITYSRANGRRIYVNGVFTDDVDQEEAGDLLNWHYSYVLSFGNELSNDRAWDGILRMVAFHDRALTNEQIQQNFLAEVGQKYQVPFSVSHLMGDNVPHSYVVFEVSQFDEYSYLFRNPRFINIDPDSPGYVPPTTTAIRGMRVGMNNQIVSVGQAYTNVSIDNISQGYSTQTGLILSDIDTVIQIQNGISGPTADEFFLSFDEFGAKNYAFVENDQTTPPPLPTISPEDKPSDIGIRTFDEINASMAQMTGIVDWQNVTNINNLFTIYRTQLPAVENIEAFQGSHQMAIAQLAMTYCDEVVENTPGYFTGFVFNPAGTAFEPQDKIDNIINPLLSKMFNATDYLTDNVTDNLTTQASVLDIREELTLLIFGGPDRTGMVPTPCTGACDTVAKTRQVVKATCAAALGSAAMLIQ